MAKHVIVMGDIIGSRTYAGRELMRQFRRLVSDCNGHFGDHLLSPYTITLGDEFQGIPDSLRSGVETLLYLIEKSLRNGVPFRLRYVVHHGAIDTPLNRKVAHGMVGAGLTRSRQLLGDLTSRERGRPRVHFELPHAGLSDMLNRLFAVMVSLTQDWKKKDIAVAFAMLDDPRDADVAARLRKTRSQIWKRRRSLHIEDYRALRLTVRELAEGAVLK
jgi:hypothetical protein